MNLRVVLIAMWIAAASTVCAVGQTTRPAPPAVFSDAWLSRICLEELESFSATGEYEVLGKRIRKAILARLGCGRLKQLAALEDMVYVLSACKYLPSADEELAKWLLDHRQVARPLLRALGDVRSATAALGRLKELVDADEKSVLAYPQLAVAFATSEPLRHYRQQPEPASVVDCFKYYTKARVRFRYDLKKMPYELSRYLANSRLDLKQRLRKVGGVCIDQAYYAADVCRALGVPATIVVGEGSSGMGHAWVACLKVDRGGTQAYWDSKTGRYEAHQYFTGDVRDPANNRRILDSEMMLAGFASQLPLQRREQAHAALVLAKLADKAGDAAPDPAALMGFAERYNEQIAAKGGKPAAATGWIAPKPIEIAVVEDLLAAAIARNLALKGAWEFIIDLRKRGRLPVEHLDRFFDTLVTKTARAYPDYSCVMVMRIVPTIPDAKKREGVFRRALGVYAARADLCGKILIALGDDFREQGKTDKALKEYERAALRCVDLAEVVLKASGRMEALLVDGGRRDMAIRMYTTLFRRARKRSGSFRYQTSHYQLGKRLAQLLRDAGDKVSAKRVDAQL